MACGVGTGRYFSTSNISWALFMMDILKLHTHWEYLWTFWRSCFCWKQLVCDEIIGLSLNHYFLHFFQKCMTFKIRLILFCMRRGRDKSNTPREKNLIATKTDRRTGNLSRCLKNSLTNFLKISDNIFTPLLKPKYSFQAQ